MRSPRRDRWRLIWSLTILLAVLLPLLAVLQYRWLTQLSTWERDRLQSLLDVGTERFCEDLVGEIGMVYRTYQLLFSAQIEDELADQFAFAQAKMAPKVRVNLDDLVAALLWVSPRGSTDFDIRQYDPAAARLSTRDWTPELIGLRDHLRNPPAGMTPGREEIPLWTDGSTTAIVIPHRDAPGLPVGGGRLLGWVVVLLDHPFLTQTLLPSLTERYLGGEGDLDLDVAIIYASEAPRLLYASSPSITAADFGTYDACGEVFRLRDNLLVLKSAPAQRTKDVMERTGSAPEPGPVWRLLVRHRAGSLEAAIAAIRRRNILISFGILLVLGASMGLLIVATRRAQQTARQQMDFVRGITHELRTPLTVISTAGENLADAVVQDPARTREYGLIIHREGRRLSAMVERVLQLARIHAGPVAVSHGKVIIKDVIAAALERYRPLIHEQGARLVQEIADDLPAVTGDRDALISAVENLIANAVKFSAAQTTLTVSAAIGQTAKGREVQIAVADRGPGIPEEEQGRIFEAFYRGRRAREDQVRGSGLGLTLVREIMVEHRGRVSFTSAAGSGSRFVLHLPINEHPGDRSEGARHP